ncbi:unnamed protein product [Symbiodinium sp. KB8]|nr:unnamed protein product [Symbiodinium sp. KB8]
MLHPDRFLSDYGIRSVSKEHEANPFCFSIEDYRAQLKYEPAESSSPMYGGNSNWRGPIWFPICYLIIDALQQYDAFFGDAFTVPFPSPSDNEATLWEVASQLSQRMINIFRKNKEGKRPVNGGVAAFSDVPGWKECVPFYEYFHGDNGAGLGASHQTGWTALVAKLIQQQSAR